MHLSRIMLEKHNVFISGKWHRLNFTPGLIISMQEAEKVLTLLIKEFKEIAKNFKK